MASVCYRVALGDARNATPPIYINSYGKLSFFLRFFFIHDALKNVTSRYGERYLYSEENRDIPLRGNWPPEMGRSRQAPHPHGQPSGYREIHASQRNCWVKG